MNARTIIQTSAVIGGFFGAVLGAVYLLFLPALAILTEWIAGDWPGSWTGIDYAPYTIIVGSVIGAVLVFFMERETVDGRSAHVGLAILGAMIGAGIGTGRFFLMYFPIPIAAGFLGANIGFICGAAFGLLLILISKLTKTTWEDQTRHCLRLRLLASAVPAVGFVACFLATRLHNGLTLSVSLVGDYLVVLLIVLALTALPVWLFGPETQRYYPSGRHEQSGAR